MKIRDVQLSAFAPQVERAFVDDVCRYLRDHHAGASAALDDDALAAHVTAGIARARGHGLTFQSKIAFFVALQLEVGPRFDEHPVIRRALQQDDDGTPPDRRIDRLATDVPRWAWAEAAGVVEDASEQEEEESP